jgi:predicted outer membrane repeat protein
MYDGTITNNTAGTNGGGVSVTGGTKARFETRGGTVSDNRAGTKGGGMYVDTTNKLSIFNAVIRNNTAGTDGGGIYGNQIAVSMKDSSVMDNRALQGGGVYFTSSGQNKDFTMLRGEISYNTAGNTGGGVELSGFEKFIMQDGTIRFNSATTYGSGVYVAATGVRLAMQGTACVTGNNKVYLEVSGNNNAKILITGSLDQDPAANIDGNFTADMQLLAATPASLVSNNYQKFRVNGLAGKIGSTGKYTPPPIN